MISNGKNIMSQIKLLVCADLLGLRGLAVRAFNYYNERTASPLKPYQVLNTTINHSHNVSLLFIEDDRNRGGILYPFNMKRIG
jgi:hypothetical protein